MKLLVGCDECDEWLDNVYASDFDPRGVRQMTSDKVAAEFNDAADPDAAETPLGRLYRFVMAHRHDD